jgi:hypothetical protein
MVLFFAPLQNTFVLEIRNCVFWVVSMYHCVYQGCNIFMGKTYQNGGKYAKLPLNIPNGRKIYQMAVQVSK